MCNYTVRIIRCFTSLLIFIFVLFILFVSTFDGLPRSPTLICFMSILSTSLALSIWFFSWVFYAPYALEISSSSSSLDSISLGRVFGMILCFLNKAKGSSSRLAWFLSKGFLFVCNIFYHGVKDEVFELVACLQGLKVVGVNWIKWLYKCCNWKVKFHNIYLDLMHDFFYLRCNLHRIIIFYFQTKWF